MKLVRSSKCSLKFTTESKRRQLFLVLKEYGNVVNFFINYFWSKPLPTKSQLLKEIVNLPETWLTARLRKVAAREALDMIQSVINKEDFNKNKFYKLKSKKYKPKHHGRSMSLSIDIGTLLPAKKAKLFDAWLHLASIGADIILDIPIKFHKQFNKLCKFGKRLASYVITEKYIQFAFEIETEKKLNEGKIIGIDTGINALASCSDGTQYGTDIKQIIERIKQCKHGSKHQKRLRRSLKQRMDEVAKQVVKGTKLVVVEALNKLNHKTKLTRRVSKNIRRSLGAWNYRYWLNRVEQNCEISRACFRTIHPAYTSQRCFECGHTERENRHGEVFLCQKCGHTSNADVNAAKNIEWRFLSGPYGAGFAKPVNLQNHTNFTPIKIL